MRARRYALTRRSPLLRRILEAENSVLRSLLARTALASGARVLDLGCGYGNASSQLSSAANVVLVDRSWSMLAQARARVGGRALLADAGALPFRSGTFSLVLAVGLLEYLRDGHPGPSEMARVVEDGGFLIATLAPKTLANRLRWILGARLFWHRPEPLRRLFINAGFIDVEVRRTWLQKQFLFQRKDAE